MSVEIQPGVRLVERRDGLAIVEEGARRELLVSPRMIAATFARYARPLDGEAPPLDGSAVAFSHPSGGKATLRAFAFKAWGDVLPSHWLLLEVPGAEPVAAPAPLVTGALLALGRAAAGG